MSNARNLANLLGTATTIQTAKIADDAITNAKILNSAITSAKITDGTIATGDMADDAVTSAKIADGTIATGNIADDAVTGAKIENTPSIANGLTLSDGNLVVASGHGIDFSANSSASGMSSELFDHYEEGTFDVTIADATSGGNTGSVTQTNKYIRVGNTVWVQFSLINITTTGLTSSNVLYFQGMPFTPATGSNGSGTGLTNQLNVDSGCFQISVFQNAGQSYAAVLQSKDNTGSSSSEVGAFDNGTCDLFAEMLIQV
tara:strand:+ start:748 stop:1524 length:777 start_codon:yes stop_codon:yes gene_type:complete